MAAAPDDPVGRQGRALVELLRRPDDREEDPLALLDRVPMDAVTRLANHHRVPGMVFRSLRELGVDDDATAPLRAAYQMAALAHARCLDELSDMADRLGRLDRPWLVIKGPVLTELGYRDPGARLYEDLDVLVTPAAVGEVMETVERAGGRLTDLNWPMMIQRRRAEVPMILPRGLLCDLHWDLLVTPNIRARFALPMAEVVGRRRTVRLGGVDVATLDVVDGLLYLCLHGVLSGGHQLVWVTDVDRMVRVQPVDWDELVRRARRHGLDLVAAMLFERARHLLGTPVPDPVLDALGGGQPWWELWRRHERRSGLARWGRTGRTGRVFLASTSAGTVPSVVQYGRSLVDDVIRPTLADRRRSAAEPTDGVPLLYRPVGGDAGRAGYLEMVEARTGW
jgi:hypothetical protein